MTPAVASFELVSGDELPQRIDTLRRAGRDVRRVDDVGDDPWRLEGVTAAGRVEELATAAAVVLLLARGADIVAAASEAVEPALARDAARLLGSSATASARRSPSSPNGSDAARTLSNETRDLLAALAAGLSIGDAAAQCYMSERTAHRRLIGAKRTLGVASTAEAVAALTARCTTRS